MLRIFVNALDSFPSTERLLRSLERQEVSGFHITLITRTGSCIQALAESFSMDIDLYETSASYTGAICELVGQIREEFFMITSPDQVFASHFTAAVLPLLSGADGLLVNFARTDTNGNFSKFYKKSITSPQKAIGMRPVIQTAIIKTALVHEKKLTLKGLSLQKQYGFLTDFFKVCGKAVYVPDILFYLDNLPASASPSFGSIVTGGKAGKTLFQLSVRDTLDQIMVNKTVKRVRLKLWRMRHKGEA